MNSRQYNLLFHPLFLLSLSLLLLNDFVFKYQFHNWLTGKLSDFAGLFVFVVFFTSLFPRWKTHIVLLIALIFCWWKSDLSESFIVFMNNELHIPANRVIDYSDLFALLILPFSLYLKPVQNKHTVLRKCLSCIIAFISFTAFTATSLPRRLTDTNKVQLDKYVRTKKDEATIINSLEEHGLHPVKDTIYEKVWDRYYLKSKDSNGTMLPVESLYAGIYKKIDYGTSYNIPKMYVAGDSITNLQFVISGQSLRKKEIWLHSFEHKSAISDSNSYNPSFFLWKKFKKPIKKKIKELVGK
jgi:hypothetical protein